MLQNNVVYMLHLQCKNVTFDKVTLHYFEFNMLVVLVTGYSVNMYECVFRVNLGDFGFLIARAGELLLSISCLYAQLR